MLALTVRADASTEGLVTAYHEPPLRKARFGPSGGLADIVVLP
jgi:hypothetical protein